MSKAIKKILIADDEKDIVDVLTYNLEREGFKIVQAYNGKEAVEKFKRVSPDLVLLDIMMPIMDGVEACRQIRLLPNGATVPIIILTARSEEYSEAAGFDSGADDYIVKPIRQRILLKRIEAVLRRKSTDETQEAGAPAGDASSQIKIHNLIIDKEQYLVFMGDKKVSLPRKEFELLYFLANNPDRVYSRTSLLENVWGSDVPIIDRTVDVHVRKLREKLGQDLIETIKGVGYKISLG